MRATAPVDLAVTGRLLGEVFAAVGSQLIETSAPLVSRAAPLALDPAIQLKALESRVKRAFFDAQQIVGQLLNQLRDRIPMQMAPDILRTGISSVPGKRSAFGFSVPIDAVIIG